MAGIRSFLAIEITAPIIKEIGEVLDSLRLSPGDVKWVKPENIHLTLKFFGNIEEADIERICSQVEAVVSKRRPFLLRISGMGAFPNSRSPKVIWLGVEEEGKELELIQQEVERKLEKIGFKSEKRPFSAHLTVGRVRSSRGRKDLSQAIQMFAKKDLGSFEVSSLVLFKSDLTPKGSIYTRLRTIGFS